MGRFVVKLEGKYFEWSTVVDAPVTDPMTLEQFKAYYVREYGRHGLAFNLPQRLERVESKGTSALMHESAEQTVEFNRAGPNESSLTVEQIKAWARGGSKKRKR